MSGTKPKQGAFIRLSDTYHQTLSRLTAQISNLKGKPSTQGDVISLAMDSLEEKLRQDGNLPLLRCDGIEAALTALKHSQDLTQSALMSLWSECRYSLHSQSTLFASHRQRSMMAAQMACWKILLPLTNQDPEALASYAKSCLPGERGADVDKSAEHRMQSYLNEYDASPFSFITNEIPFRPLEHLLQDPIPNFPAREITASIKPYLPELLQLAIHHRVKSTGEGYNITPIGELLDQDGLSLNYESENGLIRFKLLTRSQRACLTVLAGTQQINLTAWPQIQAFVAMACASDAKNAKGGPFTREGISFVHNDRNNIALRVSPAEHTGMISGLFLAMEEATELAVLSRKMNADPAFKDLRDQLSDHWGGI